MVISPLLRGLFGLDWDATDHTLRLTPHLPADWDHARLRNVPLGSNRIDLQYDRTGGHLTVTAKSSGPEALCLTAQNASATPCHAEPESVQKLVLPLPPVELSIPASLPEAGSLTSQLKVLDEQFSSRKAVFTLEAWGGSVYDLPVRLNLPQITVKGGTISGSKLHVAFPDGEGYQKAIITFAW
jgi:hypothetical protein